MVWGSSSSNPRKKQIDNLLQIPNVTQKVRNQSYYANFTTRFGRMQFLVTLPPNFPSVAPVIKFERQYGLHRNINAHGYVLHDSLKKWGVHSDLRRVVQDCINMFVSQPPQSNQPQFRPQLGGQYSGPYTGAQYTGNQPSQPPPSYPGLQQPGYRPPNYQSPIPQASQPVQKQPEKVEEKPKKPEPIDLPDFPIPKSFPVLDDLSTEELQNLLYNQAVLKDLALNSQECVGARNLYDSTRKSLQKSIEENLKYEPQVESLRKELERAREEEKTVADEYLSLKKKQETVLSRYSTDSISQALRKAITDLDGEIETLKESFENEDIKIVAYVNKFLKLKTLYHLRTIKKARLDHYKK